MDISPPAAVEGYANMNNPSPSADLIAGYLEHLRILSRARRTRDGWGWLLSKADRELPYGLDQAADAELRAWLYRDDLDTNSRRQYWTGLNGFYTWAARERALPWNPMDDLPKPRRRPGRPRPCTDGQLARILTEAGPPFRLWALLAARLGARCVEISRLDRDDVGPDTTWLHGKGDKDGEVPTHPDVWAAVSTLPPGPVARTITGRAASPTYVSSKAGAHFREQLGLNVSMHRLRHWYGTWVRRNSDLRTAQEALRHADPKTTALYTQVDMSELRAAVLAMPALSGPAAAAGDPARPGEHRSHIRSAVSDPAADRTGRSTR